MSSLEQEEFPEALKKLKIMKKAKERRKKLSKNINQEKK